MNDLESGRRRTPGALLVADVFPPAIGGSGHLLASVYSRLDGVPVTVLAGGQGGDPGVAVRDLDVVPAGAVSSHWGVIDPRGLASHVRRLGQIRRQLARADAAVVHCARALPEGLAAWADRRLGGPPYVCWAHGEELGYARGSRELAALMSLVLRGAHALIANSRNTAAELVAAGAPAERITVVYPAVDAASFRPDAPGAANLRSRFARDGEIILLTVGRLQRRKGHDLVIRALAELVRRQVAVRYVVVGTGDDQDRLEQLARDCGVRDRVELVGAVTAGELPAYYAAADVFVHPNRVDGPDFEGFGIVFLEAAAAGLAVIAGRTGGAPEAIEAGETGLLVSGTDVDELVSALSSLAADPERRRAMGAAGRARAIARFSWERAADETRRVHEQAASGTTWRSPVENHADA